MQPNGVVIRFDIFKHSLPHGLASSKSLPVNRFDLERVEEAFGTGIVITIAGKRASNIGYRDPNEQSRFWGVYAIRSASQARLAVIRSLMDQPMTCRENRSMMTARYSQPSSVHK